MRTSNTEAVYHPSDKKSFLTRLKKDLIRNRYIYLMLVPIVLYYTIFKYQPMYGAQIAFRDFDFRKGILGSEWVGLENFIDFFSSYYFFRLIKNTLLLSIYNIIFGFPAPLILALLLNEVTNKTFKSLTQTVTYLPHFISTVVVCGILIDFLARDGVINNLINMMGIESIPFIIEPKWFRTIYVISDIWQQIGWGSIIYLAALSNINPELYEACKIDGGGRLRQMMTVTLPGIAPIIIILLILRIGKIMDLGQEKVLLLYNPNTYSTSDIIATFVYRKGLLEADYSYSAAIGLFNSVINFVMLVTVNRISRKVSETSLW